MKVSVIIPTLNEEGYIEKTLSALKPQLEKEDELIIVDSYSKDNTVKIAKKYGAKIYFTERCGIGPAKTFGAKKAKNGILAMLDADGIPAPDWLMRIKGHFRNNGVAAVAGFGFYPGKTKSKTFLYNSFSWLTFLTGKIYYDFKKIPWMPINNYAIRKSTFFSYGGLRKVVCEDFDFGSRAKGLKGVKYDFKLNVSLSDRRYRKEGFLRTVLLWFLSDLKVALNGTRICALDYKVVR